ncbi:hypothetical protein ARUE_c12820 [Arthrobacter sp. Rue61a]|nr:hypothetical protein ARUE_c12820 [Arthrobacter sp. Rue61a]
MYSLITVAPGKSGLVYQQGRRSGDLLRPAEIGRRAAVPPVLKEMQTQSITETRNPGSQNANRMCSPSPRYPQEFSSGVRSF